MSATVTPRPRLLEVRSPFYDPVRTLVRDLATD